MKFFTIYNELGQFGKVLGGDEQHARDNTPEGCFLCEGAYDSGVDYFDFDVDEPAAKREIDIFYSSVIPADGTTKATIQVPEYIGLHVVGPSGNMFPLTSDEIHFSTPEPGTYTFQFTGVEFLDKRIEIHAT